MILNYSINFLFYEWFGKFGLRKVKWALGLMAEQVSAQTPHFKLKRTLSKFTLNGSLTSTNF